MHETKDVFPFGIRLNKWVSRQNQNHKQRHSQPHQFRCTMESIDDSHKTTNISEAFVIKKNDD